MDKDFLDKVKEEVLSLKDLEKNWDGDGADTINLSVIDGMVYFVDEVLWAMDDIPVPYIIPGGCGCQFEWHLGKKSLEIEFEDEKTIHYLKWDPGYGVEEEDIFSTDDDNWVNRCMGLLLWFLLPSQENIN